MRYYTKEGALLLRGLAFAAGTDLPPGGAAVRSFLFAPVPPACPAMPAVELAARRAGLDSASTAGLPVSVDVNRAVVTQYDGAIAFALADRDRVILVAWTPFSVPPGEVGTLLEGLRRSCPVPPGALVLASDAGGPGLCTGPLFEAGAAAVAEALARRDRAATAPAFLIYSRFGGGHWVEWSPEACPYYPCHHLEGQRCDHCYCPFYPCRDPSLGDEVVSSTSGAVWNCSRCTLLHLPVVADHLNRNPMASLAELKRVASRR
ncbi:MAG TPA: cysteine-rich small domain-containing protein [Methanoregulaceae archaeon]|nr:cysteine-rich small domain-containing protein [Methanoregulaceae archaeon]